MLGREVELRQCLGLVEWWSAVTAVALVRCCFCCQSTQVSG